MSPFWFCASCFASCFSDVGLARSAAQRSPQGGALRAKRRAEPTTAAARSRPTWKLPSAPSGGTVHARDGWAPTSQDLSGGRRNVSSVALRGAQDGTKAIQISPKDRERERLSKRAKGIFPAILHLQLPKLNSKQGKRGIRNECSG